jgi:hypothetical protein
MHKPRTANPVDDVILKPQMLLILAVGGRSRIWRQFELARNEIVETVRHETGWALAEFLI